MEKQYQINHIQISILTSTVVECKITQNTIYTPDTRGDPNKTEHVKSK